MNEIVKIEKLGHQGDGLAITAHGNVFVPFTLGGEEAEISGKSTRKQLVEITKASDVRVDPVCKHFGECGGCQLQHFSPVPYQAWKRQLVVDALSAEGIVGEVEPLISFPAGKRRRAVFSASHSGDGVNFGFSTKATHTIINIDECPVLIEDISSKFDLIKNVIRPILPANGTTAVHVLASDTGLDIYLDSTNPPNEKSCQAAMRLALKAGIARLSIGDETLVETKRPSLNMGIASVNPPAGTFVQAIAMAEKAMVEIVCEHLKKCKKVADLFCGAGTFSLPLAESSTVFSCESDAAALSSLNDAWRATGGALKAITTDKRDLYVRPVMAGELKKIQGVVFDPPRAGAEAQAKQLALSKVRKIAAVSCNPTTLARDLAILIAGGFKVERIVALDQFVYTPHVEVAVLLGR